MDLLQQLACELSLQLPDRVISVEWPGYLAIFDSRCPQRIWEAGTANGTWAADLMIEGKVIAVMNTGIPKTYNDAGVIARCLAASIQIYERLCSLSETALDEGRL